jgi:hypothetical protein
LFDFSTLSAIALFSGGRNCGKGFNKVALVVLLKNSIPG